MSEKVLSKDFTYCSAEGCFGGRGLLVEEMMDPDSIYEYEIVTFCQMP
jgi:hypothetical protein